jgi:hypothetical protein
VTEDIEQPADEESPLPDDARPEPSGRRPLRRLRLLAFIVVVFLIIRFGGDVLYDPPSRLPQVLPSTPDQDLFGATRAVLSELQLLEAEVAAGKPLDLKLSGSVYVLPFPRTFADRLFGERRERAAVFTAEMPDGGEHRFLKLSDGKSSPIYAVESVAFQRGGDGPAGVFVAVPQQPGFETLLAALAALGGAIDASDAVEYSTEDFTLLGPFARGDRETIQDRIRDNAVLQHLVEELEASREEVSLTPPLFLIARSLDEGVVRAVYQPYFGAVLEPPWETSRTSTLAHELVHAYMDKVAAEANAKLSVAAGHFEEAHPRLYGEVISELYSQLDRRGRAEEALANIVAALAAGETRTVEAVAALRNQRQLAEIAEPILSSDLALLLEFGLLPDCMAPGVLGYEEADVTFAYYDLVRDECG